jgi:hypothetical protein
MRINPRGSWPGLGLTISDDASHDEVRVIHDSAKRHGKCVAQLAALMDRSWRLSVDVTNYSELLRRDPVLGTDAD